MWSACHSCRILIPSWSFTIIILRLNLYPTNYGEKFIFFNYYLFMEERINLFPYKTRKFGGGALIYFMYIHVWFFGNIIRYKLKHTTPYRLQCLHRLVRKCTIQTLIAYYNNLKASLVSLLMCNVTMSCLHPVIMILTDARELSRSHVQE